MESIEYIYKFEFDDGRTETFHIGLDAERLNPLDPLPVKLPAWTKLEFKQCPHCPLHPIEASHCPLAARLVDMVDRMADVVSYNEVDVTVTIDERTITRSATAQEGISSLMGIITATSGCPHTEFFKPMARFHLPFASSDETFYRAASMYMLGQYYRWQRDLAVDLELVGLKRFYEQVAIVNKGMAERIRAEKREDGTVNAIVLLDMFVKSMPHTVEETLMELMPLFLPYLRERRIDTGDKEE